MCLDFFFSSFITSTLAKNFSLISLISSFYNAAYSKRGEEIFAQLADLATTCQNLMADFRGKLANEEMLSHNVHPGKR